MFALINIQSYAQQKYNSSGPFSGGLAWVGLNDQRRLMDISGKEAVPSKYDYVGSFEEGLARVCLNGKCGYIDKTGKMVIHID